jgi:hypothetical protein
MLRIVCLGPLCNCLLLVQVKGAGLQEEQIAYICAESLKVRTLLARFWDTSDLQTMQPDGSNCGQLAWANSSGVHVCSF